MRPCLQCAKPIRARRSTLKFCSPRCRLAAHRKIPQIDFPNAQAKLDQILRFGGSDDAVERSIADDLLRTYNGRVRAYRDRVYRAKKTLSPPAKVPTPLPQGAVPEVDSIPSIPQGPPAG